jgi:vitamin B12/bleomycin/antimicrobial peptide transport system ATP-binding/permease protein
MFWVAVLYSGLGSVIAHLIGPPLIRLNNRQQAVEADFRFSLVRLREELVRCRRVMKNDPP